MPLQVLGDGHISYPEAKPTDKELFKRDKALQDDYWHLLKDCTQPKHGIT